MRLGAANFLMKLSNTAQLLHVMEETLRKAGDETAMVSASSDTKGHGVTRRVGECRGEDSNKCYA